MDNQFFSDNCMFGKHAPPPVRSSANRYYPYSRSTNPGRLYSSRYVSKDSLSGHTNTQTLAGHSNTETLSRHVNTGTLTEYLKSETLPPANFSAIRSGQHVNNPGNTLPTQYPGMVAQDWFSLEAANLANTRHYQDLTAAQTFSLQQQLYTLQYLQDATERDVQHDITRKEGEHPFYWRRRQMALEGRTRTRDKYRVVYTNKQRVGLEDEYERNKFITSERKQELSKLLQLSDRQIKIWFQNRRAKERREKRKSEEPEPINPPSCVETGNTQLPPCDNSNTNDKIMTSCRFAGKHTNREIGTNTENRHSTNNMDTNLQPGVHDHVPGHNDHVTGNDKTALPGEGNLSHSNGIVPKLNVSPLTVNTIDFGFSQRM